MALFGKTKKTKDSVEAKKESTTTSSAHVSGGDLSHVLQHARITEKASMHAVDSVYVFNVSERASKRDIMAAVRKLYNVTPRKVSVATVPSKMKRSARTGKIGMKKGGRKAYIYLKKGETIEL